MSVSRKTKEIEASVDQLVDALDITGVDKRTTLVLGGGALAFAGIRPAHDLDMMIPGEEFERMEQTGQTPSGLSVVRKKEAVQHPFLRLYPAANKPYILPTDITFPYGENFLRDPKRDREFTETIANFNEVGGYRFLPPRMVAEHKMSMERPRFKDRRDVRTIGRFLGHQHS